MPKISELPSVSNPALTATIPVVNGSVTSKITIADLAGLSAGDVTFATRYMTAAQVTDVVGGTGAVDVTDAVQAAIDVGGVIIFPAGAYKVTCSSTSPFDYGNSTTPVYRALNIDQSNLTIVGMKGATIHLYGYDNTSGGGTEINFAFSTAKNMTLGTLSNIRISGLDFDFNPTGKSGTTYRSFHLVGVRGIELSDLYLYSSGSRAGATITVQNSEQVRFRNIRMRNITQGMNFSYVDDVQFDNIMLDYFSEGIDFDRMVSRCVATNVTFTSTFGGVSGQCWDLNSVRDSTFKNITAYRCTNVLYNNFKKTTPPTYADYVNNTAVTVYTPSRNNTFDGINIHTCAPDAVAILVGDDADTDPGVLTRDITLRNVNMVASGSIEIRMSVRVLLDGITMSEPVPESTAGWACIVALKGTRANAECSVAMRNIIIKDIANSQDAIRLSECSYAHLDNLHIENYPLDAVEISGGPTGGNYSITNSRFLRTVDTVVTGVAVNLVSITNAGTLGWSNNTITQYTTPINCAASAAAALLPQKIIPLGQQAFTSGTKNITLFASDSRTSYIGMVKVAAMTAAVDGVNYVTYTLRDSSGTAICSGSDTGGLTTGTLLDIGFAPPESLAEITPGESLYLAAGAVGTGRTLDGFAVVMNSVEYQRV